MKGSGPPMIYLELFCMVKHSKNTHLSKTKFVFDFIFSFGKKKKKKKTFVFLRLKKLKNLRFLRFFEYFLRTFLFLLKKHNFPS